MDFLKITDETEVGFKTIANILINQYAIQTHDSLFRMTDLEFYWDSQTHEDKSTYKRNYVDPKAGDWFFHYSGVDIALKNENGHGGILIRGIYDTNEKAKKRIYKGPMVCAMRLFSGTSAFNRSIQTQIIVHEFDRKELSQTQRKNLGQNAVTSGTDQLNYRFFITP